MKAQMIMLLIMTVSMQESLSQNLHNLQLNVTPGLERLMFAGHELHPNLKTAEISNNDTIRHIPPGLLPENPHISTDRNIVKAIIKSGSQGKLDDMGIRSVLYAIYKEQNDLGFYGFEVTSIQESDRLATSLQHIWQHNITLGRAQIHRKNQIILVLWHDAVSTEIWETVNNRISTTLHPSN